MSHAWFVGMSYGAAAVALIAEIVLLRVRRMELTLDEKPHELEGEDVLERSPER